MYIQKIRHETLRVTVIQRLEEYLNLTVSTSSTPPAVESEAQDSDDDSEDNSTRGVSPVEPEAGMWVGQCKQLFLWYYDIYLVFSSFFAAVPSDKRILS